MNDQARGLAHMAGRDGTGTELPDLPALAITGGKGGVGKTCLAVNLALLLQGLGMEPLLVDLDMGLANADVLLGVNPSSSLFEVVIGGDSLASATVTTAGGLHFVPAASGRDELTRLGHRQFVTLFRQLADCGHGCLVLDTMAGISAEVTRFLRSSRQVVVVLTPDPTALTDAYALIKVLEGQRAGKDLRVIVNQAGSEDEAMQTFLRLRKVVRSYLQRDIAYLGHVPRDRHVQEAVRRRVPFITDREAPASRALAAIAMRLRAGW
ncbi:MAG: P-loop NTPase [Planctomycetota bacterium]